MRLGIIGRGPWGDVYAETLRRMGVEFWQSRYSELWMEQDWMMADGIIIASSATSHYRIADDVMDRGIPVLIEKPICLNARDSLKLLKLTKFYSSIVFAGHTRLYSGAWREFKVKAIAAGVKSVSAIAGGPCKLDPLWDWGPHLVAMCLDLGFDPLKASITTGRDEHPLTLIVNKEMAYIDRPAETPRPLDVLLTEFIAAIEKGEPDIRGLELGVKVVEALEEIEARQKVAA